MNNEEVKFIFCTECGTKNEADANFCTSCGTKLIKPVANPEPVVVSAPEEPVQEEVAEVIPEPEETVSEETPEVVAIPEEPVIESPAEEEPAVEEEPVEEESAPEIIPEIIPEAEEPAEEEPVAEEPEEEEPAAEPIPVIIPVAEEPNTEEPVQVPEEQPKEEKAAPVVVPVTPKVSKKEAKLEKKLEEAKKQAQEQARKEAEKAEAKAQKEAEKAQKAEAKAQKSAEKAEKKAKKTETVSEPVQNNSRYYYNPEENIAPPAPAPAKKRRQNFFLKFLSFLLALILTASLAVALPITLLNLFLTDHNIEIIVDHVVSSIELEKLEFTTADGSKSLSDVLLDITDEFEGWNHITEEQINDALLEDFVKQFVTDTLKQYGMSLKDGEQMLGWTPEQIYDFVEANKETIEQLAREAGYEGKLPIEEKKDMMIANIEQKIGKDGISVNTLLGGTSEADKIADYLNKASILFSDNTLYLAWGLVAFIVILLIFVNIAYFGSFLRACGFPAFIIGCIYFLAALAVNPVLSLIKIPNTAIASAVDFTVGFLAAFLMDISLIVAAVGLGMILISFIADAIKRKINKE